MRRCCRGAALALGGVLMTSLPSLNSCSLGSLTVYAAEDALTEELETAFQEDVLTGESNVETDIPAEETANEPAMEETEPAGTVTELAPVSESGSGLEDQEYQILLKIVEAEAGGEDLTGRILVANVVMNRVRSDRFPNTITEVVYQRSGRGAQFSPVSDGRIDRVGISAETVEAVSRALGGEDVSAGALYFRSVNSRSGWFDHSLNRVLEYGNHIFYTL
ncbi:MAG: cell wall hydrolase [Lachnospiraceae bacterium]